MKMIFIVERDEDNAYIFGEILKEHFIVCLNRTWSYSKSLLAKYHPDIFLLDGNYEDECLNMLQDIRMHEHLKHTPVVLCSTQNKLRDAALEMGFAAFIDKPFELEDFLSEICSL